jgi:putative flippase GtrA
MKNPINYIPEKYRSVVRFVIAGTGGVLFQYGVYYLLLHIFRIKYPGVEFIESVAFTTAYVTEMINNYFVTCFFTFKKKPSLKNALGFLLGRTLDYFIQILRFNLYTYLEIPATWAGLIAIILTGIINYFVLLPFYKEKKKNPHIHLAVNHEILEMDTNDINHEKEENIS